ncbi:hypothetical protein RUMCAL_02171 [Ruminococcus callidus ATCC 27760]|uniref:Uncharacterized protein n=1 Tax=Ruminococcus callidus ATCC 27760 TaxID=411473 RepID=U2M395_9FIRM|nr:hypothetical protein RUMCAL_02171 [Ruminococcus callidus ATCC 27760]
MPFAQFLLNKIFQNVPAAEPLAVPGDIYIIPKIKTFFKSFIAQNSACTFIHYDE